MRSGRPVDKSEFKKFLEETDLNNGMVGQLCGLRNGEKVSDLHFNLARDTLDQKFFAYCVTEHASDLLSSLFSTVNLPNIIQEIPNRTLPKYVLDTKEFEDEICERNQLDFLLYKWVVENPRIPEPSKSSDIPSPATVVMYEETKEVSSEIRCEIFPTEIVMSVLQNQPEHEANIKNLYEGCLTYGT